MKIAIGSDHAGLRLKTELLDALNVTNNEIKDFGTFSEESVDYPGIARNVASAVASGEYDRGILVCGSGVGVCMVANKVRGVRAVLCSDEYTAKVSRQHNNANVLALGGRTTGPELAKEIVQLWLAEEFDPAGRHARRVAQIEPDCY